MTKAHSDGRDVFFMTQSLPSRRPSPCQSPWRGCTQPQPQCHLQAGLRSSLSTTSSSLAASGLSFRTWAFSLAASDGSAHFIKHQVLISLDAFRLQPWWLHENIKWAFSLTLVAYVSCGLTFRTCTYAFSSVSWEGKDGCIISGAIERNRGADFSRNYKHPCFFNHPMIHRGLE